MKKVFVWCLVGVFFVSMAIFAYEEFAVNEEIVVEDDYGGPVRRLMQKHKQKRQQRFQRRTDLED